MEGLSGKKEKGSKEERRKVEQAGMEEMKRGVEKKKEKEAGKKRNELMDGWMGGGWNDG